MENQICPAAELGFTPGGDWGPMSESTRRTFLRAAGMLMAGMILPTARLDAEPRTVGSGHKVIIVVVGGVRRDETFSPEGQSNIPHLTMDMLPKSLFYAPRAQ